MSTSGIVFGEEVDWSADFFVPWDWSMEVSLDWVRFGWGVRRMIKLGFPFFRRGEADSSTWTVLAGAPLPLFLLVVQGSTGEIGDWTSDGGVTMHSSDDEGGDVAQSKEVGLGAGHQPAGAPGNARIGPQLTGKEGARPQAPDVGQQGRYPDAPVG